MKNIFKQIIIEFHSETIPDPILRKIDFPELPPGIRKAFVFVGMRRSGKTWYLYQKMRQLLEQKIDYKKILYINFEDDRLINLNHDFQAILDAYFELYPEYSSTSDLHFFFDEIHEKEGWEAFIRRLLDREKMQLYITGTSAKLLSKEIATALRGRSITREIFPFSFAEYLEAKNVIYTGHLSIKQVSTIKHYLEQYKRFGGFPEVLNASDIMHRELLQNYIEIVVYRDIVERYKLTNMVAIKHLIVFCLQNSASSISINKIYLHLKSRGISISKDSLYEFMNYFMDAYCIFSVPLYSFSIKKTEMNPKKIYTIDSGLITAFSIKPGFDEAAYLETLVFIHLRRMTEGIYYYTTAQGKEVDFLTLDRNETISLYQVTMSLSNETTKKREFSALYQAMEELGIRQGIIITWDEEGQEINDNVGAINIIPIWKFLLPKELIS